MPSVGMPWIKLYTEFVDDPKVGFVDELAQLLLVKLYLVAGECDAEGYLANGDELLTKEHVAWRLRLPVGEFCARWDALEAAGLVAEEADGALVIPAFQDRQGRSQSEKREQWRERKRRQRETHAGQDEDPPVTGEDVPDMSRGTHAGITGESQGSHAAREEKRREEGEKRREDTESGGPDARAPPSTFAEWQQLLKESGNRIAVLRQMAELLYPGLDPPDYSYIGKVARKVGGAGRLADLLWQHSTHPPTGDLLAYILAVAKHRAKPGVDVTSKEGRRTYVVDGVTMPIVGEEEDGETD